jgi:hypothetical protein
MFGTKDVAMAATAVAARRGNSSCCYFHEVVGEDFEASLSVTSEGC